MADTELPRFKPRYVLLPVLLAVALTGVSFFVSENLRSQILSDAQETRTTRERLWAMIDLMAATQRAESDQRGYLLTQQDEYRDAYYSATHDIARLSRDLPSMYGGSAAESAALARMLSRLELKVSEMTTTVELAQGPRVEEARQLMKSDSGRRWMQELRAEAGAIEEADLTRMLQGGVDWERKHAISRYIAAAGALISIILIVLAGAFISRDIQRRNQRAIDLDRLVAERTQELTASAAELEYLSTNLLRVSERERAKLARELHDELGSLLVAMKMDLAQLAKKLDVHAPDVAPRWQRIQTAISAGVDLKRRVIEELRPTLLDNVGLCAALRWQVEQSCAPAQLEAQVVLPDQEPTVDAGAAIAVFRAAQEALTNIVKHARATRVRVALEIQEQALALSIDDNGIGISATAPRGHGLAGMRHRVRATGGSFQVMPVEPRGTRVLIRVPLAASQVA